MIVLENSRVRLEWSEADGTIRRLRDVSKDIDFIAPSSAATPFRLEKDAGFSGVFERFEWSMEPSGGGNQVLQLSWHTPEGVIVSAIVSLHGEDDFIEFSCSAVNGSGERLLSLEYPVIPDMTAITADGEQDFVAHPFATGFEVQNPMRHFEMGGTGFRFMPYPESFSGAAMQFFTYYGKNRSGLYFAAVDGEGHPKWLNFYKNESGLLEASFIHGCEDIGAGKGIDPGYTLQVALLEGSGWYEAADRYKRWAVCQKWCARGKLSDRARKDGSGWLHEEMGAATFGINAGSDRTPWLQAYHDHIGTPMFHILGPDWTNAPQTFYKGVPGGFDDWFPTRFNGDNIALMKEHGDKFAPFEFDYLYHFEGADGPLGKEAAQKFPEEKKSIDKYRFPFLCPAHPYTHDFHVRRDEALQQCDQVDSIYYDISANNILKICMDDTHGHPVGAGKAIEDAYRRNYADTKAAMIEAAGRYVPMGTEMMNETMLDLIDYYQARAGGQPAAPLEGWPIRELLKTGEAVLIPMFTYVYHEYGALRLDGWGKLTEEIGSLYYFTVARTYLWGGLYELNYEYSPMESLGGAENAPEEHYYPFEPRGYAFSDKRAAYLSLYAKLRTGAANKYWAYGRMLQPFPFECSEVRMDWFHYNHGKDSAEYNNSGELLTNSIVHSAWDYGGESVGLFFANVKEEEQSIHIRLKPNDYGKTACAGRLFMQGKEEEPFHCSFTGDGETELRIPSHSVILLELS
ncbi:DUF6259 domain-containing protein [Paenibacillus sp. XY044]|uniref:DUF6259 domain-containing protein n=1 Tax=Paenibacillus sp. XY044 TaxID=2026089 RepID=UPI000B98A6A6|nr:DUF6259 domain-containing protein [Paenibacillus sp. XY044]OZB95387.1 hypothetical protein CJP46_17125 [Paenibacillus sp. XY044]